MHFRTAPSFGDQTLMEEDEDCDELDGLTSSVDRHDADSPDSDVIQFVAHAHDSDTDICDDDECL